MTLLIRNSVEVDNKGHPNTENMRQSQSKRTVQCQTTIVSIFLVSVNVRSDCKLLIEL